LWNLSRDPVGVRPADPDRQREPICGSFCEARYAMHDIARYYAVLELDPGASEGEIRQAYTDLMKVWHPDRFLKDPRLHERAEEKTKLINEAYEVLRSHSGGEPPETQPDTKAHRAYSDEESWETQPAERYTNSMGMEFVLIRPGRFLMGSPDGEGEDDEHPRHKVRITKPFYMGIALVTQAQWKAVMGTHPSHFRGDDLPVEWVSWNDVRRFLWNLNRREDSRYRLPAEAEWEYACRAGSQAEYCHGNGSSGLGEYAWYSENSDMRTHPVCRKKPNAFGLFDVHGNVWEWCEDWYRKNYYKKSPINKPRGPATGKHRVIRGGCWELSASMVRSAYRLGAAPDRASRLIGFRCVKDSRRY